MSSTKFSERNISFSTGILYLLFSTFPGEFLPTVLLIIITSLIVENKISLTVSTDLTTALGDLPTSVLELGF